MKEILKSRVSWTDSKYQLKFKQSSVVGAYFLSDEKVEKIREEISKIYNNFENEFIVYFDKEKYKKYYNDILSNKKKLKKYTTFDYSKLNELINLCSVDSEIGVNLRIDLRDKRYYLVCSTETTKDNKSLFLSIIGGITDICFDVDTINKKIYFYPILLENYEEMIKIEVMKHFDIHSENTEESLTPQESNLTPTQLIIFGAPGTGKSYKVNEMTSNCVVYRTTIYSDYSYFDFVGSIMPRSIDGVISYEFNPGVFTLALKYAIDNPFIPVFLVVEEMSRGNIASIFGDIFQLLDRDLKTGESEYGINNSLISSYLENSIDIIKLPSNLSIIGTVNTSDQNVNVIDTAFKRRFDFEYMSVDPIVGKNEYIFKMKDKFYSWNEFYVDLNKFIVENLELPEDKQIGQFFIKFKENDKEYNNKQIANKLLHYLWEDVQSISLTDSSIFDKKYKSFSKIYEDLNNGEYIFSEEFKDMAREVKIES